MSKQEKVSISDAKNESGLLLVNVTTSHDTKLIEMETKSIYVDDVKKTMEEKKQYSATVIYCSKEESKKIQEKLGY
jgi:D-tyrosyl-tRNA(Tyr) deacylase